MENIRTPLNKLVRKRAGLKSKITLTLNKLDVYSDLEVRNASREMIKEYFASIKYVDDEISDLYLSNENGEEISEEYKAEMSAQ